jgi:hypothetical protein
MNMTGTELEASDTSPDAVRLETSETSPKVVRLQASDTSPGAVHLEATDNQGELALLRAEVVRMRKDLDVLIKAVSSLTPKGA